ncbi:MAG TPA: ATP-binding protein, partial [bacterium]|nr:ATP-binding protein [bacterium]
LAPQIQKCDLCHSRTAGPDGAIDLPMTQATAKLKNQELPVRQPACVKVCPTKALQFGEQRLKYAFEAASEGIWDWDLYLNKVYFSPRFYTMLEYVPDEFPASIENLFNLIHEADVEKIKSSFFNFILSPEENYEQIFRMKTKTENEIWIMARGKIVELKNGKPARFIGTHIDITEQIKTHNKLLHSEKLSAVGQLASGIAHEFNNILAIIKSYAQLVLLQLDSSPDYTEIMTEIDNQVKRGSNIVKSIMAFSRPREMVKELCDIKTLINRVIKIQNNFLELENIEIFTNFNYDSLLYVDANQIEQVLINVVLNARHAIAPKKKGIITVSAEEKNGYITITVTDTGIGIPEDKIKKIFEPFYTTKGARGNNNLNIGGTGLGLSVCYTIIKNHGGFISVESKINEGASFMISLPVEQNGDKILMENSNNSEKKVFDAPELKLLEREMKIIIVDDERLIADMLSRALKKIINAEIDCYYNRCDAIDNFLKKKYDIAFLDLLMPGIDGLKISEEFKKLEPSIKIVFMSGQIGLELDSFMSKDIFGYIQKPFSISDIIKVLNKIE